MSPHDFLRRLFPGVEPARAAIAPMPTGRLAILPLALAALLSACASPASSSIPSQTAAPPTPTPVSAATLVRATVSPKSAVPTSPSSTPAQYVTSTFSVPLSLGLVDGWSVQSGETIGDLYLRRGDQDAGIMSIASMTVPGATTADPRLAWPSDLYAWLDERPEYTPTQPVAIEVDGHPAIQIDTDTKALPGTRINMIGSGKPGNFWLVDGHEADRFIEVRFTPDTGVVIFGPAPWDAPESYRAALDQLVASIQFP